MEFKVVKVVRNYRTDIPEYNCYSNTYWCEELNIYKEYEFIPGLTFYRYMDNNWGDTSIDLYKFKALRETPCGYWILDDNKEKWISKDSMRRFCYPTKEEAWHNFVCRKKKQLKILKSRVSTIENVMKLIKDIEGKKNE